MQYCNILHKICVKKKNTNRNTESGFTSGENVSSDGKKNKKASNLALCHTRLLLVQKYGIR